MVHFAMGPPLNVESWIWYGLVVAVACARYTSRILLFRGNLRKLQVDDALMLVALCSYTCFLVCINIVSHTNSNLFPHGFDFSTLTPADVRERRFGSKLVLVVEQCQCVTVWAVKGCLLIMYYRLTVALRENLFVKIIAVYVAFGFIFMEVFYFGVWCRPFHDYWAVPTPNAQCNAATDHLITNAVFNISSDLMLLVMALQMIIRTKFPLRSKLILCCIFGLGIFVVLASVLNKYYSFANPFGWAWTFWYVRESSTSLLVANLPFTWTLLRRLFKLRAFDGNSSVLTSRTARGISYHSSRTARGRASWQPPSANVGETTSSPDNCSSWPHADIAVTAGVPQTTESPRHSVPRSGSFGSSGDAIDSSRSSARRSDNLLLKSWREQEVYGRAEQEALGIEPWDFASDLKSGSGSGSGHGVHVVEAPREAVLAPERRRPSAGSSTGGGKPLPELPEPESPAAK